MADITPRRPEQFRTETRDDDFDVSELLSEAAGAHSPFGDLEIPMPLEAMFYQHPAPEDRPNLADGR